HLVVAIADAAAGPVGTEIAVMQQVHRVALRADLAVNLEAPLHGGAIVGAEGSVERPGLPRQRGLALGLRRGLLRRFGCLLLLLLLGGNRKRDERGAQERERKAAHQGFSIGRAAPATGPPPVGMTVAAMLVGSGKGRSNQPISGKSTRKWKK